ncbi:MFS transporter [Pectinatus frisingensis]|uniref:MFS transporter n=1 Tax=Pectinatus frisingensis TaxID=865 RepID=UPI0015F502A6|nr:MFS transporter [Pectinatus frisingensis]
MDEKKVFISVLLTSFFGPFMGSSVNVAIPSMALEYGVNAENLTWILTLFLLGSVILLLPSGKYADMNGRRKVYQTGCIGVAFTTLACVFAPALNILLLLRFMQGIFMAMNFSTGMAMLVASHPPQKRGQIIGYSASCVYMGLSLGPVIGGALTQFLGWRTIFIFTALGIFTSIYIMSSVKQEWYGDRNEKLDMFSSLLYALSAASILYGLSDYARHPLMKWLIIIGLVLAVAFIYRQNHIKYPLFALSLFKNTIFAMSNTAALIHYSATFGISFTLSLYLQVIRGFDALSAGMLLLLQPIMMSLLSPLAGALSDKFEPRLVASSGMGITAFGLYMLSHLTTTTTSYYIGSILIIIGIGFALFSSPNNNAIMGAVQPKFYGVASSTLAVMRMFGQAISMAIVTFLLSVATKNIITGGYIPALLEGIQNIFTILSLTCTIGIICSLARGTRTKIN